LAPEVSDLFGNADGATPLDPDERDGLIPTSIATRGELNEAEEISVAKAAAWAYGRTKIDLLTDDFVKLLHKRMFGEVWSWAGQYRHTGKNIGIDASEIPSAILAAVQDARYWVDHKSFAADELCVGFHHRLVLIHAFPNGNGRHARLIADLLVVQMGESPFSWGRVGLTNLGETRARYIAALNAADNHDIGPLLKFARS
jgi:Fic-DOC domain mobile mystery protein B